MSSFVNYRKRSFTLPTGCKDLIDVLQTSKRGVRGDASSIGLRPAGQHERFPKAGLAEIDRLVSKLLDSDAERFFLAIRSNDNEDNEILFFLYGSKSERTIAIGLLITDAEREQIIRGFFEQHGIKCLNDSSFAGGGGSGVTRGLVYALPRDTAKASKLTIDLLRCGFDVKDESGLCFHYYELASTA